MSGFDIKNLANPLYFEENVLPPHSDHKYYGSGRAGQWLFLL